MNGFLKTAATISKKSAKNCLSQGFLVTCWSGLQRLQKPFMTPLVAFGKLAKSVLILIEAFTNLYKHSQNLGNKNNLQALSSHAESVVLMSVDQK
jgi:hypothetical protein